MNLSERIAHAVLTERERAKSILASGSHLGVGCATICAAILEGTDAQVFARQNEIEALARRIVSA